jgi:hypothetical protein
VVMPTIHNEKIPHLESRDETNTLSHPGIRQGNEICGVRRVTFGLLCLLCLVVIGAAVGGGVGGSLAVENARKANIPSSAPSRIASSGVAPSFLVRSTTTWGPLATDAPFTGCPANNRSIYTTIVNGENFQIFCDLDTSIPDLLWIITPTFQLCIEACSSWNNQGRTTGKAATSCAGVAFVPSWRNGDAEGTPADCFLKPSMTVAQLAPNKYWEAHVAMKE